MAEYGKFSQSAPFRALLSEFVVEAVEDETEFGRDVRGVLIHNECGLGVYYIEDDDDMSTLVQGVIEHDCDAG